MLANRLRRKLLADLLEFVAGLTHESCSSSQVVVLQRGDVIVRHGQLVSGLNQEVIVHTTMLKVVNGSSHVGSHHHEIVHHLLPYEPTVVHDHVDHLDHTCHMQAADRHTLTYSNN